MRAHKMMPGSFQAAWVAIAVALILEGPYLLAGSAAPIRMHDLFDAEYPRAAWAANAFLKYGLVEWWPEMAGGLPFNVCPVHQLFPENFLAMIMPVWAVYELLIILFLFAASYGFYLAATRLFALPPRLSQIAAVGYALAIHLTEWVTPAIASAYLFPAILVLLHATLRLNWIWRGLLLVLIVMVIVPIFAMKSFVVAHGVVLLLLGMNLKRMPWRDIGLAALFWLGVLVSFSPTFMSLMDFMEVQNRIYVAETDPAIFSYVQYFFLTIPQAIIQNAFLTTASFAPLVLVAGSVAFIRGIRTKSAILLAAYFLYAMATVPLPPFMHGTPFEKMDLSQLTIGLPFLGWLFVLSALAEAPAASALRRQVFLGLMLADAAAILIYTPKYAHLLLALAFHLVMAGAVLFALRLFQPLSWRVSWRGNGWLANATGLAGCAISLLLLADQLLTAHGRNTPFNTLFGDNSVLAFAAAKSAEAPLRVGMGDKPDWLPSDIQLLASARYAGLETIDGRNALFNKHYKRYMRLIVEPQFTTPRHGNRFDTYWYQALLADRKIVQGRPLEASMWRLPLLAASNTGYILSHQPIPGLQVVKSPDKADPIAYYLHAVPAAFPRAYLVSQAIPVTGDAQVEENLRATDIATLRHSAWVSAETVKPGQQELLGSIQGDRPQACKTAAIERYEPDRIDIRVEAMGPCLLVVANTFDKGWRAEIEGQPVPVWRTNLAFQGIPIISQGSQTVRLTFAQPFFFASLSLYLAGLGLAIGAGFFARRRGNDRDR